MKKAPVPAKNNAKVPAEKSRKEEPKKDDNAVRKSDRSKKPV